MGFSYTDEQLLLEAYPFAERRTTGTLHSCKNFDKLLHFEPLEGYKKYDKSKPVEGELLECKTNYIKLRRKGVYTFRLKDIYHPVRVEAYCDASDKSEKELISLPKKEGIHNDEVNNIWDKQLNAIYSTIMSNRTDAPSMISAIFSATEPDNMDLTSNEFQFEQENTSIVPMGLEHNFNKVSKRKVVSSKNEKSSRQRSYGSTSESIEIFKYCVYELFCGSTEEKYFLQRIKTGNCQLFAAVYMNAAERGYISVLQYLMDKHPIAPSNKNDPIVSWEMIIKGGIKTVVQTRSMKNGLVWNWIMCMKALQGYQFKVIEWMIRHNINIYAVLKYIVQTRNAQSYDVFRIVKSQLGNQGLEMLLSYANSSDRLWLFNVWKNIHVINPCNNTLMSMYTCREAASNGHLEILKWARENGCPWDERTCSLAASNGHLEVLKWARENGCPWDEMTCIEAARYGHLEILKWARENGCPWDEMTCKLAARYGHLEILKWARENGCPWDERTCSLAAINGHLEVLKWALENGCPWDENTCRVVASNGHLGEGTLEILKLALENGCPCDARTNIEATINYLESSKRGCIWNESAYKKAVRDGLLEVLKWARENGCPWNEWTCSEAARYGNIEVLKWARENGCPWDENTCSEAARYGNIEVLKWARENGCPWDEEAWRRSYQDVYIFLSLEMGDTSIRELVEDLQIVLICSNGPVKFLCKHQN